MSECPCRYCTYETGRSSTCHGTCERYLKWDKEHKDEVAQAKRKKLCSTDFTRSVMSSSKYNRWKRDSVSRKETRHE